MKQADIKRKKNLNPFDNKQIKYNNDTNNNSSNTISLPDNNNKFSSYITLPPALNARSKSKVRDQS